MAIVDNEGLDRQSTDAAWVKPFALKAIAEGDAAMLEVLAERDIDVVALEWNGDSALHFAVKAGHMAIVRNLISHGANINAVDTAGNPPLFLASESGHPELIQELVVNGADVNALNTYEETVLQDTVKRGRAALALWLVEQGADVHAVDSMGFSISSWVEMAEVREAVRSLGQLVLEHEVQFFQAAARARASSVPPVLPSSPETINGGKRPGGQLTSTPKNKLRREPQEP